MTVGSNVKSCVASIRSIEATLETMMHQNANPEAKKAFSSANEMVRQIKKDLEQQVIRLANEEPQYK
ncbi:DUF1657 domain-containing protein [Virgibacillus sp. 179-BFC.A HS]|uniref:DUF1657 domain-containing protein n=1 Tax=Tigheibacillus jepli TaxID=3035914 RepID=A0ABU5CI61_9BACI|nr:DUF1657 domain-containing protein [Virgibacillus sp. 179-BFC.A HS]MDY0406048.1 DUF1657 domain-containing protein [Virgibacillus sp. 179-BFC.A HS]